MHYRTMFDNEYLGAWDLSGKDVTVTIEKVEAKKIKTDRGETKKPILYFAKASKPMIANKTNTKLIASMYGNDVTQWIGKRIVLYPTTTSAGGETVECIRVRPTAPKEVT